MGKILGIDLGTTRSIMAVVIEGSPVVIPTAEGELACPSVVAFDEQGQELVGQAARQQAASNPRNTISSVKRLLGRRIDDPDIRQVGAMASYQIVTGPHRDARIYIPVRRQTFTSQEIVAKILQKLQQDAAIYLAEPVNKVVIAIPPCFDEAQQQMMVEAGYLAGLEVCCLVNEAMAAGLTYNLDNKQDQSILIFDLGGGMANASILEIRQDLIRVKASYGDRQLGGDHWDEQIVSWLVHEFKKETSLDLRREAQALQRLREAAEQSKIELSTRPETEINLPFITANLNGPKHLQLRLTRSKFEQLAETLVERCRALLEQTLREAGLHANQLDQVILMGGAAQMPVIRALAQSLTGRAPNEQLNPNTAVAQGAAILGHIYESRRVQELDNFLRTLAQLRGDKFDQNQKEEQTRMSRDHDDECAVQITLEEAFYGATRTLPLADGRSVEAKIPPGAYSGLRLRFSGQGQPDPRGGPPGDLYLTVEVAPNLIFQRVDDDLHLTLPIGLDTALLGGQVEVSGLDRTVKLTIPPETMTGRIFRLRGLGMPQLGRPDQRGDLYAAIEVQLPQNLSPEEKELLQKWRELRKRIGQGQDGKGDQAAPQNSPPYSTDISGGTEL